MQEYAFLLLDPVTTKYRLVDEKTFSSSMAEFNAQEAELHGIGYVFKCWIINDWSAVGYKVHKEELYIEGDWTADIGGRIIKLEH